MNWRRSVFLFAALMVLLCGGVTTSSAGESADTAALGQVLDKYGVAWSSGDSNKLLLLFTEDVIYEDVPFGAVNRGSDALRNFATGVFDAFPGITFEVKSRIVASDGKWGALEWVMRGKQAKDLPGLPATNTPFEIRGSSIVEFRDGKVSRCSDYWDLATYLKQVGLSK